MKSLSENRIDGYEKKIPVYQLYRMYREKRLVFPSVSVIRSSKMIDTISETLEMILLGVTLPIDYVSELQDGSLLVLDNDNRLRCLMKFVRGDYVIRGMEFYPELDDYDIELLEQRFPRFTSLIYDYKISLQIIEYTTPKYMHMQVGSYIEKWNFTREQGIRNKLYGKELERFLKLLVKAMGPSARFFSVSSLNRQYMVLRILMYRLVFRGDIQTGRRESMGLQLLLDQTIKDLKIGNETWEEELAEDLREATKELVHWEENTDFGLAKERGKEWQAKVLGYLYNVVWMCWEHGRPVQWGLERIAYDHQLWRKIDTEKIDYANIRRHFDEIEKRLDGDAESY